MAELSRTVIRLLNWLSLQSLFNQTPITQTRGRRALYLLIDPVSIVRI